MSNLNHRYDITESSDLHLTNYVFISEGPHDKVDVSKIIQFEYVREFMNKPIFNLGFGDFDMSTGEINDESMSENGDVYKVFNTVLSTIPMFLEKHSNAGILVRGSDGEADYESSCRRICVRNCIERCHKFNRRMKLYCNYVSKKYTLFGSDCQFLGGSTNKDKWFNFETFVPGMLYDALLVSRKMFKFDI